MVFAGTVGKDHVPQWDNWTFLTPHLQKALKSCAEAKTGECIFLVCANELRIEGPRHPGASRLVEGSL
jgi:hypothetical protein